MHAQKGGKITTAGALVCCVLGFVFSYTLGAFWSIFVAVFLATFETPFVYRCFGVSAWVDDPHRERKALSARSASAAARAAAPSMGSAGHSHQ